MIQVLRHHAPWMRGFVIRLVSALLFFSLVIQPSATSLAASPQAPVEQSSGEQGVVRPGGADLYDTPNGSVVEQLAAVSFVTLVGRTQDETWVVVTTESGGTGWVQRDRLIAYNVATLPVMMEGAPVAQEPTPVPAMPTATPRPPTATPVPPTATRVPPTPTPVPPTATPTRPAPAATAAPASTSASPASSTVGVRPLLPSPADIVGIVGIDGATLFDGPDGAEVRALPVGSALALFARDDATEWLQVRTSTNQTGWLLADEIVAFSLEKLPVAGENAEQAAPAGVDAPIEPAEVSVTEPPAEEVADAVMAEPVPAANEADVALPDPVDAAPAVAAPAIVAPVLEQSPAEQTARVAPADDGRPTARVTVTDSRVNIRSGPGVDFRIVTKAVPQDLFTLVGRTEAGDWLQVELSQSEGGAGWVSRDFVESSIPVAELPVVDGEATGAVPAAEAAIGPALSAAAQVPAAAPASAVAPITSAPAPSALPLSSSGPTGYSGNLVFQDGLTSIYVMNLSTGEVRRLTDGYDPAISPDGRIVAFTRGGGADNGIYTIGIDGSNERKIWGEGELLRGPKWSPDGKRIVFSRLTGSYQCYDLKFIGCKSLRQLIAEFPFLIFPEARRRFLADAERLEFPNWGISRVSSEGGDFRDIAALDSAVSPDWNVAGIVYQSTAGIEVTEDTPAGNTRAIFQEDWDHDPDWQPNGGFMLFQSKEGSHWEIWRITPEGTGIVALTRPQTTLVDQLPSNVAPAWSYDGAQIVYLSNRDDNEDAGPWRLWVMNPDGSNKRRLPIDIPIEYSFASEQVVDWGPPLP